MSLVAHAEFELRRAGLFDKDSDYGGAIGDSVMTLMRTFAEQGHSGFSAMVTLSVFEKLARFKPLTSITSDPSEWMDVADKTPDHEALWQNRRQSSCFSNDGGRTYYDIDADDERAIHIAESHEAR